jgi:hypothetical protein
VRVLRHGVGQRPQHRDPVLVVGSAEHHEAQTGYRPVMAAVPSVANSAATTR